MKILDTLVDLLFDPNIGANKCVLKEEKERRSVRSTSARIHMIRHRERQILTIEELDAERIAFRKSLARTDY